MAIIDGNDFGLTHVELHGPSIGYHPNATKRDPLRTGGAEAKSPTSESLRARAFYFTASGNGEILEYFPPR